MLTGSAIIRIIITITITAFIVCGVLFSVNVSGVKIMLLGVAIITFSNAVLKGGLRYGMDEMISVIGFGICIAGFLKKER